MNRHFEAEAIVLDHLVLGEDHRLVTFYLPERGLVKAMAHGSNKNKHRYKPLTQSFTGVEAKFYHDPVKDQYKVVDLKARYQPLGLGQSLDRIFWASVWAEVVLATRGGGGEERIYHLLDFCFPDLAKSQEPDWLGLQTAWRVHYLMGWGPEDYYEGQGNYLFSRREGAVIPGAGQEQGLPLLAGSLAFLSHTLGLDLSQALKVRGTPEVRRNLEAWLFASLEYYLERPLKTLRTFGKSY